VRWPTAHWRPRRPWRTADTCADGPRTPWRRGLKEGGRWGGGSRGDGGPLGDDLLAQHQVVREHAVVHPAAALAIPPSPSPPPGSRYNQNDTNRRPRPDHPFNTAAHGSMERTRSADSWSERRSGDGRTRPQQPRPGCTAAMRPARAHRPRTARAHHARGEAGPRHCGGKRGQGRCEGSKAAPCPPARCLLPLLPRGKALGRL
jgi:hypothetical protein